MKRPLSKNRNWELNLSTRAGDHLRERRVALEALEQRNLLTSNHTWVNDNWYNESNPGSEPYFGDLVINSYDQVNPGTIAATYGVDGFGSTLDFDVFGDPVYRSRPGVNLIYNAIQATTAGGTVHLLDGTLVESDIVIDRPLTLSGTTQGVNLKSSVVPEVTSSQSESAGLGVGTHQGIIIYSPSVTIRDVVIAGSSNGALPGGQHYHQGITTIYELQNGGNYNSLHNGPLPPITLGSSYRYANETVPGLLLDNVYVVNARYRGITLSPLADKSWDTGPDRASPLHILNSQVIGIGDWSTPSGNGTGIVLQNFNNTQAGVAGNIVSTLVDRVGNGIVTRPFGQFPDFGNPNAANNNAKLAFNTVGFVQHRGYEIDFGSADEYIGNQLRNSSSFPPAPQNATGFFINHSRGTFLGTRIEGAKYGFVIQNTSLEEGILPILSAGTEIYGRGGPAYGVLMLNSIEEPNSVAAAIGKGVKFYNYNTAIWSDQVVPPADGRKNNLIVDRPDLNNIPSPIALFDTELSGQLDLDPALTRPQVSLSQGSGLAPGFKNNGVYYNSPANSTGGSIVLTPPTADELHIGYGDFAEVAHEFYAPLITGQSGTTTLFDFNAAVYYDYTPSLPWIYEGWLVTPNGAVQSWFGGVVQNGGGTLIVNSPATSGHGSDFAYGTHSTPTTWEGFPVNQLIPTDISNRTTLSVVARSLAGNQAQVFRLGLMDYRGNVNQFTFSFSDLNSSAFTTLSVNLLAPSLKVAGPDAHFDLTKVVGYVLSGDQGTFNGNQQLPFRLEFDEISAGSIANSVVRSSEVTISDLVLTPEMRPGYFPGVGQSFTIINNEGSNPVTGTFAGQAEGSFVTVSGVTFKVSYTGGTGNDVVLSRENVPVLPSSVIGRHLFYNQSGTAAPLRYDGNNLQINANDDLAIATNKSAYLPGSGAATFANVSSYTKGINGIMVDIAGTHGTITAADFIFRVGNNNTPNSWVAAPAPSSISVRAGAGTSGSDRVVLTWANGAITKKWLEVIVLAGANTGLSQKAGYPVGQGDVFFFGNAVANSGAGDNATQAIVNVTDELGARNNPASLVSNIPITNLFDYNRDGQVNTTDALASRNNPTNTGNVVRYISVANPPAAPEASAASDDGGVASALSAPSAGRALAGAGIPRWLANRLRYVDLNSGPIARYFEHLADQNTPAARTILVAADKVANEEGLDDSLLDSLLADLGLE